MRYFCFSAGSKDFPDTDSMNILREKAQSGDYIIFRPFGDDKVRCAIITDSTNQPDTLREVGITKLGDLSEHSKHALRYNRLFYILPDKAGEEIIGSCHAEPCH